MLVEVNNYKPFLLYAIYASPKFALRKDLWLDLIDCAQNINLPWAVIGDFNEVVSQREKYGGEPGE